MSEHQEVEAPAAATVPALRDEASPPPGTGLSTLTFSPDQIALLKRTVCKGATDDEFRLFAYVCQRTGLDPFAKQIHAVKRKEKGGREVMAIQTGIDGYRLIADRAKNDKGEGTYEGQTAAQWCGEDGVWKDVWLDTEKPPRAARTGVFKKGFRKALYAVALWDEYAQYYNDGEAGRKLTAMWQKMGVLMLAKCAEALALRKAFPLDLAGVYTDDEMAHASTGPRRQSALGEALAAAPLNDLPEGDEPVDGEVVEDASNGGEG